MPRIESKVRDLVAGDDGMRAAVEIVLDRADDGDVKWVDVKDELSSGRWGRLIETGVLVEGEEGFRLADRTATESGLETDDSSSSSTVPVLVLIQPSHLRLRLMMMNPRGQRMIRLLGFLQLDYSSDTHGNHFVI
ncbi:MAG: hypothetical protein J07HQW1_02737 [Haloquadratum walsbyi J07HQW1]|uniref:Uncharacterized protein n=1 Tax=Haloquadratum walsbyi J07HQW1 TaxID=1238424 RepID=U1PKG6_9EURY|nr:MAG: hypothetical protein J07HQW1_02737 [Haloquadratum walsbyi J07HQW1]